SGVVPDYWRRVRFLISSDSRWAAAEVASSTSELTASLCSTRFEVSARDPAAEAADLAAEPPAAPLAGAAAPPVERPAVSPASGAAAAAVATATSASSDTAEAVT